MTYYCIYDGYSHRESSMVGRDHHPLKVEEDWLDPFKVAVGVSLVVTGTAKNRSTTENILGFWDVEDFNSQFDDDPIRQLRDWSEIHLVGKDRWSGNQQWELLANRTASRNQPVSPERFALKMRDYGSWYGRIANIEVPQGFNV